ncbi:glycoside hydrolase family 5 protein [Streptomyces rhizosphaerihabitans]|uniref:glycoside hydrolase family 5 protein n=1 Tax=Streptomyces rhizosphaerihabitans TaxID=1266770 RepID=UPI0021C0A61F|nr:glycoside hydrolase family 5 protein [Streptomyces rhizosphaerihabitans]MCT9009204.1 glycoside hydrolase family 5 protein [Streptomyces rhizosphaerihabitans]
MLLADDQRGRRRLARTASLTTAAVLAVLCVALGYADGTGLFAPENWLDAGFVPGNATSPAWATVVFMPLLIGGSAVAVHRLVRAAAPGARARWVFGAVWSSLMLVAFLAKLAYSALLLVIAGPGGLHLLPTAGALLAECGLTGAKYAVFGPLVAGLTAAAYRIGVWSLRGERAAGDSDGGIDEGAGVDGIGGFAWLPAGAAVALQAGTGAFAWAAGPIPGGSGVAILVAGGAAVCAGAGLWRRVVSPGLTRAGFGVRLWSLATTLTAAGALGFAPLWVLDGCLNGFGGALFPVASVLVRVAEGVTAGVCASVVAVPWAAERAWRRRTEPSAERRGLARAVGWAPPVAIAVLLALAVGTVSPATAAGSGGTSPRAAGRDRNGLLPLTVLRRSGQPPVIGDSAGRQVLLRGVNVNQLIDYGQPDPAKGTVWPLEDSDYALMARYGFDVQRLALSWSALEPKRGEFDEGYLARVRTAVDQAAAHGIHTVLDMHQDTFSKYVSATPGTHCRPGATPEFGNDGAPDWATLTDGARACGFLGRDLAPNVQQAFTNLYDDTDGIGTELAHAWGRLAAEFADDPAVAGYDLLNEPGPGDAPGVTSSLLLGRLYQQAITSIRAAESKAASKPSGGFHHLVFFEPSILWSGLGFDTTPPVGFADDPLLVFSPHLYSESITMDQGLGVTLTSIEQGYTTAERTARAYGAPLWSGEWGWFGDPDDFRSRFDRFLARQNTDVLGSAIWVWKKACGDPQNDPAATTSGGGVVLYTCPDGKPLPSPAFETTELSQAYPRSAPGRLNSLRSSATTRDLRLSGSGVGTLDVWVPGPSRPEATGSGLTGIGLVEQPGGWRFTAHTSRRYTLHVT